ncbi:RecQ family zinc-binding domain-containing protein, partial [candidate division WOR-3 bacterium]|nr:RecQ family zinc-binding domain-containing protein [candidate division WOR-3 bacterium]
LKTLLVYLETEGIIRPKYTRFEEYAFKCRMRPADIADKFTGERKDFVKEIFNNCHTKKIWTYVDIQGILDGYGRAADRQRIVAALEYFSEKEWIELQSKQAIEVYEILAHDFNLDVVGRKICRLFEAKENHEIQRIHNLVDFFESTSCISKRLARYFGEDLKNDRCGHCSFCKTGQAVIQQTTELQPLSTFSFKELTGEFIKTAGDHCSALNVAKFLCGISSPALTKLKVKNLAHHGIFERYPFLEVKSWVNSRWR